MLSELTGDEWLLAYTMSNISERCYYADWMSGLEYVLWNALKDGERRYGHGEITADDIKELEILSGKCESWIYFDDNKEETSIPLNLWQQKFAEYIKINQEVLK